MNFVACIPEVYYAMVVATRWSWDVLRFRALVPGSRGGSEWNLRGGPGTSCALGRWCPGAGGGKHGHACPRLAWDVLRLRMLVPNGLGLNLGSGAGMAALTGVGSSGLVPGCRGGLVAARRQIARS